MRRVLYALSEIRKSQLEAEAKVANLPVDGKRLSEVDDLFRTMDSEMSGISPTSTNQKLAETMTSADFTYAIQEFVQRQALPGYQRKTFAFEPLVWSDTVPNFMNVTRYQRRAGVEDLEYVGEKGQARPGSVVDATKRQYRAYRFEKQFDFSYEALRNDDLGYFEDVAIQMGEAARRSLEKYVSRMYFNATSIARLVGLGALYAQNGRLTSTRISECRMAFNQRVDARNEPIAASLRYLVYHRGLADTVNQIQNSELVPELATNGANVVRGTFAGIEDPYLTGAAPNLPWFGFVGQDVGIRAIILARLQGWPGPRILRKRSDIEAVTSMLGAGVPVDPMLGDFDSGNVVLKVVDVWGTYIDGTEGNLFDFRGAYYSSGTAP
jgi:hypothetical protein